MDIDVVGDDVFARLVSSQLPPDSAAMSTMMAPYFMRPTMSRVMITGAFLPGIAAVVITTSAAATALASFSAWAAFSSAVSSRA